MSQVSYRSGYSEKEVQMFAALGLYEDVNKMSAASLYQKAAMWIVVHYDHYLKHSPLAVMSLKRCLFKFYFDREDPVYRNNPAWEELIILDS